MSYLQNQIQLKFRMEIKTDDLPGRRIAQMVVRLENGLKRRKRGVVGDRRPGERLLRSREESPED